MAREKELHFFDNDALFQDADPDYAAYHEAFPDDGDRVFGETTPIYMYWPGVPGRIHTYNPAMQLIVLLRHPVDRAYSHWQMEAARGFDTLPFARAIREEESRLAGAAPDYRRVWSYVDRGRYLRQLHRLWELFGEEGVLVLESEFLRRQPDEALARVAEFLGVLPFTPVTPLDLNAQSYATPMAAADREYLLACFAPEVDDLELVLGWDLAHWRR